jgi:hypothetical protein
MSSDIAKYPLEGNCPIENYHCSHSYQPSSIEGLCVFWGKNWHIRVLVHWVGPWCSPELCVTQIFCDFTINLTGYWVQDICYLLTSVYMSFHDINLNTFYFKFISLLFSFLDHQPSMSRVDSVLVPDIFLVLDPIPTNISYINNRYTVFAMCHP